MGGGEKSLPPSGGKVPPQGADEGAGRVSSSYGKRQNLLRTLIRHGLCPCHFPPERGEGLLLPFSHVGAAHKVIQADIDEGGRRGRQREDKTEQAVTLRRSTPYPVWF